MDCDLQIIHEAFEQMQSEMHWDTSTELLYEHFFADPDPEKLQTVAHFLAMTDYQMVNLDPAEDQSGYFLHVARMMIHSPESLHEQNLEFNRVATSFKIESYDGWEAGPIGTDDEEAIRSS
jgi:hypothetical protein